MARYQLRIIIIIKAQNFVNPRFKAVDCFTVDNFTI